MVNRCKDAKTQRCREVKKQKVKLLNFSALQPFTFSAKGGSMGKLEGTKTQQCLINAFAGESQARNRYTYFASVAKKEGFEQISAIFLETADNEKEHAKLFYKHLGSGSAKVEAVYPFHLGNTIENLRHAAAGEHEEWTSLYLDAAEIATEEGFTDIANTFKQVLEVEKHHEQRYLTLVSNIESDLVFKKQTDVQWKCRNCGRVYFGIQAPLVCPTCFHPQAYFELLGDNF